MQPIYRARAEERNKFMLSTLKASSGAPSYTRIEPWKNQVRLNPLFARAMGTVSCTVLGTRYPGLNDLI